MLQTSQYISIVSIFYETLNKLDLENVFMHFLACSGVYGNRGFLISAYTRIRQ
jgi:limonene-1,2-epoxide hydrolase